MIENKSQNHNGKDSAKQKEIGKALLNPIHSGFNAPRGMRRNKDSRVRPIVSGWQLFVN
jgi:hypothetical protein